MKQLRHFIKSDKYSHNMGRLILADNRSTNPLGQTYTRKGLLREGSLLTPEYSVGRLPIEGREPTSKTKMPRSIERGPMIGRNPAAVLAQRLNRPYEIVTNLDGSQTGYVTDKAGNRVEEWQFYRDYENMRRRK